MKEHTFRSYAKYYDQIYLKRKDYQKEAEAIKRVIRQHEKKSSKTLLDIGCGTGEHVKHLSADFQCVGVDINREMIIIAKNKIPKARFKVADMTTFRLEEKFDVAMCLFGSIGYVQSFDKLVETIKNIHRCLNDNGLVIIEPWIFRKDFLKGTIAIDTYECERLKLARMATSKIAGSEWLIFMHYLIGEDEKIRHAKEVHRMLAIEHEDYVTAFESANFKDPRFLKENLWDGCRGLFIGTKQDTVLHEAF